MLKNDATLDIFNLNFSDFLGMCDVKYSLMSSVEVGAAQLNASEEANR